MPKSPQELISTPNTAEELFDQKIRSNQTWSVRNSPINFDVDNVESGIPRINNNNVILATGERAGISVTRDLEEISGNATILLPSVISPTGTRGSSLVVSDDLVARVSGITFKGFVYLGDTSSIHGGNIIFQNCVFEREIFNWGKAHFIGCVFNHAAPAQVVLTNNSGAAANVYIIGCSRRNGGLYGGAGVTVIAETT
jgi:hypothetical protein